MRRGAWQRLCRCAACTFRYQTAIPAAQIEILLNLFTGFYEDGEYCDELSRIGGLALCTFTYFVLGGSHLCPFTVWRYVRTPSLLLFDLLTSVPFSYYDFYVYQASSRASQFITGGTARMRNQPALEANIQSKQMKYKVYK